jgi:hypothetical protein
MLTFSFAMLRPSANGVLAGAAFLAGLYSTRTAAAQNGSASTSPGVLVVTVVDSAVHPIASADVELLPADSSAQKRVAVRTNDAGVATLSGIAAGKYLANVRKLNFSPGRREDITIAGDTVRIMMMLTTARVELDRVEVKGTKGSALARKDLTAAEINTKHVYTARDALNRYRPGMFTDTNFMCNSPQTKAMKIYVNGVRRDFPFGNDPLDLVLAKDIQEMHYVGCGGNKGLPVSMMNSLYVVLKPKNLSKREEKALRELMRDTTANRAPQDSVGSVQPDSAAAKQTS